MKPAPPARGTARNLTAAIPVSAARGKGRLGPSKGFSILTAPAQTAKGKAESVGPPANLAVGKGEWWWSGSYRSRFRLEWKTIMNGCCQARGNQARGAGNLGTYGLLSGLNRIRCLAGKGQMYYVKCLSPS